MMPTKTLNIDEKWSVEYDPENNDRPVQILRHGEATNGAGPASWDNFVMSMFYALLEQNSGPDTAAIRREAREKALREARDIAAKYHDEAGRQIERLLPKEPSDG